jgi:beta-glucosidase
VPARFSVRWTGTFTPPVTGEYALNASSGGSLVRIFLDDRELTTPPPPTPTAGAPPAGGAGRGRGQAAPTPVALEGGRRYALRVEARPAAGRGGAGAPPSFDLMWLPPAPPLLADALAVARRADVIVAFVGLNPGLEGEEMSVNAPGFKGGDRTDLALPAPQEALLAAVAATGKPVIVVLTSGSAVAIGPAAARAGAVLAAWYGGEEIGTAIADTLAGVNNPAGRLPVTFYRSVDQLPPFEVYAMQGRTYRYFTGDPLYTFGFGLSYSTFAYSDLRVQPAAGGGLRITARVSNTSARDGDEVVQVYVGGGTGPGDPIRELKGFTRVHLRAGERREVAFTLAADALPAGRATISIGGGQPLPGVPFVSGTFVVR